MGEKLASCSLIKYYSTKTGHYGYLINKYQFQRTLSLFRYVGMVNLQSEQ